MTTTRSKSAPVAALRLRRLLRAAATLIVGLTFSTSTARADEAPGTWTPNGAVTTSAISGDDVYIGGDFTGFQRRVGHGLVAPLGGIDSIEGKDFPYVDGTVDNVVPDSRGGFFISGDFTQIGDVPRTGLAHVLSDGTADPAWNLSVSLPPYTRLDALLASDGWLYIAGGDMVLNGGPRQGIARVSAATGELDSWSPGLEDGTEVYGLTQTGGNIYARGDLGQDQSLAAFSKSTGSRQNWGPEGHIYKGPIVALGSTIYVGGTFETIGGEARRNLAAIDAVTGEVTDWDPSPNSTVYSLTPSGDRLYVSGDFGSIGGETRDYVAAIDLASGDVAPWRPHIPDDLPRLSFFSRVTAATETTAYVSLSVPSGPRGGSRVIGLDADSGAPSGFDLALSGSATVAVSGDRLYLGGYFDGAGPTLARASGIARLSSDGTLQTNWDAQVTKSNGTPQIYAMTTNGAALYFDGDFDHVGGQARTGLAAVRLTDASVTPWTVTTTSLPSTLAANGDTVFLGGFFSAINGQSQPNVAAVDAASGALKAWNPRPNGWVRNLAITGNTLFMAGAFSRLGDENRPYLAAATADTGTVLPFASFAPAPFPTPDTPVTAIVASKSFVYAGGSFTTIGGAARTYLAAVDQSTGAASDWHPSAQPDFEPQSVKSPAQLALSNQTLIVAPVGEVPPKGAGVRLTGLNVTTGAATPFKPYFDNGVRTVATVGSRVFVGGTDSSRLSTYDVATGRRILSGTSAIETPQASPTPTAAPALTPPAAAPSSPNAAPLAAPSAPVSNPSRSPEQTAAPKPPMVAIIGGKLQLRALALRPSKRGRCPKLASVRLRAAGKTLTKRVRVTRGTDDGCEVTATIRLPRSFAKAKTVALVLAGRGTKTIRQNVKRTSPTA